MITRQKQFNPQLYIIATMITTNIIRMMVSQTQVYKYQAYSSINLSEQDIKETKNYIEELDSNLIYMHPYLYANNELEVKELFVILSRGSTTEITFVFISKIFKNQALEAICNKFLLSFQFLNCPQVNACFNPFQENNGLIPGLSIQPVIEDGFLGIVILPVNMLVQSAEQISNAKMLLDYSKGHFYSRKEIVKVDKKKCSITFRNGQVLEQHKLKKVKVKNISGFPLAERLNNYYQRIQQNNLQFMQNWNIQLDSRFMNKNCSLIQPGSIMLKGVEKTLRDLVSPMSRNTYNHYFRLNFNNTKLDDHDNFHKDLVLFFPHALKKSGKKLAAFFEKLIPTKVFFEDFESLEKIDEVKKFVEHQCVNNMVIYLFLVPQERNKGEEECIKMIKTKLIQREMHHHLIQFDEKIEAEELDIIAFRNLSVIFTKTKLNPWKLKEIPFSTKPTIVCSVNVEQNSDGRFSVAMISSMNSFFSKFSCYQNICNEELVNQTIFQLLKSSLQKFLALHKIIPFRIFLFRTGRTPNIEIEFKEIRQKIGHLNIEIANKNTCVLTYIKLNKNHPFRSFIQNNENHITYHTVKKTQLLNTIDLFHRNYVQLQFDEPPVQLDIHSYENDPTLIPKVLQLTVKLCYGSAGNQYGKGMGFLDYGAKLNKCKDFEGGEAWQKMLKEGFMFFL